MSTIKEELGAAISARKDSLKALRGRIIDLLADVPVGVKLIDDPERVDGGLVCKVVRVCTGASQWSNRTWDVTIKGWALIDVEGKLIAECIDGSHWDGNNMHHRSTEPTCLGTHPDYGDNDAERGLSWASGKATRAVAMRLPDAIARYMTACETERDANQATLA
jgi:hypothetical protein